MKEEIEQVIEKGFGVAVEKAVIFIEKLIGPPLLEGVAILTDNIEYWRFKNKVKISLKVKDLLIEKGIKTPKTISIKDLSTLLEYSSFEEDEFMQNNWVKLLVNSLNPENKFDSNNIFIQILNQISYNEINLLLSINKLSSLDKNEKSFLIEEVKEKLNILNEEVKLVLIDNLLRLGLLKEIYGVRNEGIIPQPFNGIFLGKNYSLTSLGKSFLNKISY